jgi:endonuclease YncB( thermonuclease family)
VRCRLPKLFEARGGFAHLNQPVGCFGPEVSAYTKHLLTGRRVRLVYDRQLHDTYGRWLAYIYWSGPAVPTFS